MRLLAGIVRRAITVCHVALGHPAGWTTIERVLEFDVSEQGMSEVTLCRSELVCLRCTGGHL